MFNDLRILVSGDYNVFKEGFTGTGIYGVSGLQPCSIQTPIYVGSTTEFERRIPEGHMGALKSDRHTNAPLQNYYNKYGKENVVYFLLESSNDESSLFQLEQKYIDFYGTIDGRKSFNILKEAGSIRGGALGHKWTEERREKFKLLMSTNHPMKGKKHTAQSVANMLKGRTWDKPLNCRPVRHIDTGIVYESITAGALATGQTMTHIQYRVHNKKKNTENDWELVDGTPRKEFSSRRKGKYVKCLETGVIYDSCRDASRQTGTPHSTIHSLCRGRIKNSRSFHFKYVEGKDEKFAGIEPVVKIPRERKKIKCVETGETFKSVKTIADRLGGSISGICTAARKTRLYKGLHWEYV